MATYISGGSASTITAVNLQATRTSTLLNPNNGTTNVNLVVPANSFFVGRVDLSRAISGNGTGTATFSAPAPYSTIASITGSNSDIVISSIVLGAGTYVLTATVANGGNGSATATVKVIGYIHTYT